MTTHNDATELGLRVTHIINTMLEAPVQLDFAALPLDVMGPDGLRRAYVLVTLNEGLLRQFETVAMEAARKRKQTGGQ